MSYKKTIISWSLGLIGDLIRDKVFRKKEKREGKRLQVVEPIKPIEPTHYAPMAENGVNVANAQLSKVKKGDLAFGRSTGLLVKPAENGGIVVLLPIGKVAESVKLEGPRDSVELIESGFANPHRGIERQHWRIRHIAPEALQRKLGRVGKVKLVVDGVGIKLPKRLDERME